jgi:hypothetical protein
MGWAGRWLRSPAQGYGLQMRPSAWAAQPVGPGGLPATLVCGLYPAERAGRDTRSSSSKSNAEIIEEIGWLKSMMMVGGGKKGGKVHLMLSLTPKSSRCAFLVSETNKQQQLPQYTESVE